MISPLNPDALTIPKIDAAGSARGSGLISFAGGTPHPDDLPTDDLAAALQGAMSPQALAYGSARGEVRLLEALQDYFARERIAATPARTMVTSGAMAGLDLVFRRLVEPGDVVVVESPTYSDALISLALARARVVELPIDSEGARVDALEAIAAESGRPRLVYVMPTYQNPTGVTMSEARRERLLEIAAELGTLVVEDDAYGAFRFGGRQPRSLLARSEEVIGVRSLSKIVAPGFRLGCVIGAPSTLALLEQARGGNDICASPINQEAAALFIATGAVDRHVRRLRERFRARRDAMTDALSRHFADLDANWTVPEGGMFVWVRLRRGLDTTTLLEPALDEGVSFVPGSVFSAHGEHRESLRLCFASVGLDSVEEGVRRLRSAVSRLPGAGSP